MLKNGLSKEKQLVVVTVGVVGDGGGWWWWWWQRNLLCGEKRREKGKRSLWWEVVLVPNTMLLHRRGGSSGRHYRQQLHTASLPAPHTHTCCPPHTPSWLGIVCVCCMCWQQLLQCALSCYIYITYPIPTVCVNHSQDVFFPHTCTTLCTLPEQIYSVLWAWWDMRRAHSPHHLHRRPTLCIRRWPSPFPFAFAALHCSFYAASSSHTHPLPTAFYTPLQPTIHWL